MPHDKSSRSDRASNKQPSGYSQLRPGQDFLLPKPPKPRTNFPDVGVTLSTYRGNMPNALTRSPQLNRSVSAIQQPFGRWSRIRRSVTLKRTVIVLLIVVLAIGGWLGFKFAYNAHKLFGGNLFSILNTTKLRGEDTGRVNILLAGNSADDTGHQGAQLTDSIMILSIDTKNNNAYLLSVPRDLWVNIPDSGYQKINYAYVAGENSNFNQSGYFPGGMGELQQVIQQNFGITLNYYALVDYAAMRDAVNAVGGVDVNIQSDDPRGLYDPSIDYTTHGPLVKLTNGEHHLDGQQALDLARARGDDYRSYGFAQSDFTRTKDQRLLLVALKDKAVSAGVISNPAKLGSLSDAVGNNVKTDFSLSEIHRLYDIIKKVNSNSIQSLSLNSANGKNLLMNYESPNGESALIPAAGIDDYSQIQAFIAQQTSSNPVVREDATVVVLNATDTSGLAAKERTVLSSKGLNVAAIADAQSNQATTTIIDASGGKKPATRQLLVNTFGNSVTTVNPYANYYQADFIVLLGANLVNNTSTATTTTSH